MRVVVATILATAPLFESGSAAELSAADDENIFRETALLEVVEQARDGQVHIRAEFFVVVLEFLVRIPRAQTAGIDEDEAHAPFSQSAGAEQSFARVPSMVFVETVETADVLGLGGEVHRFGHSHLHLEGQFVGVDALAETLVIGILDGSQAIELIDETDF